MSVIHNTPVIDANLQQVVVPFFSLVFDKGRPNVRVSLAVLEFSVEV